MSYQLFNNVSSIRIVFTPKGEEFILMKSAIKGIFLVREDIIKMSNEDCTKIKYLRFADITQPVIFLPSLLIIMLSQWLSGIGSNPRND